MRRLEVRMALRHAADRNELMLYYQPQRSLHTGNINGVEALIRWRRPGIGTVPPQEFIPISEESNLIIPIGNWTTHKACEQAASWLHDKGLHLRVGVNIAARQIRQETFVVNVRAALERSGLPPSMLELELTESSVLEDVGFVPDAPAPLSRLAYRRALRPWRPARHRGSSQATGRTGP